ncbi:PID-CTERM protein-sorting domain-containing protein [Gelidibacter salicanalis]|uniref:Signal peptidase n=1 Tax=Gelidibacter salicanalis TaxID=291193 RepID=A0A934KRW6_9FLAO|nr:hypothetical protein [Gelidibacter salicanalis]MBJ7879543.1 hypothetical protein [Gelidibacter salicanalis]
MIVHNKKNIATTLALCISVINAFAYIQEPPMPEARDGGGPPPPVGVPIDNGILILFAVAIIYGVYKILKRSKKQV